MKAMQKLSALVGAVALGVSALALSPTTAAAGGPELVADSYDDRIYDCGYAIDVAGEFTSSAMSRTHSPKDPDVFFERERYSFREVWTNPVTGAWFVIRGQSVFTDLTVTPVGDDVYEYTSLYAGQPFVIEDSTGRVVARDRGVIRVRVLLDTGGDADPEAEFVDFLGLDLGGPHPTFDTDTCRYASDLIGTGSTSSQRYSVHPAGSTGAPLGYVAYLPPTYGENPSPLLVFLHGSGESGDGSSEALALLATQAIPRHIATDGWPDARPFVVLAPQHADTGRESDYAHCFDLPFIGSCVMATQHELGHPSPGSACATPDEVRDFIAHAVDTYDVDPARVYLTGLSCGGFATWEYLAAYDGTQVAAAVPVAGDGRPAWDSVGCDVASVPVWALHGALDDVVDPAGSIVPITRLRTTCGVAETDARLTVHSDRDHDSWNITYASGSPVDIYTWMLGYPSP